MATPSLRRRIAVRLSLTLAIALVAGYGLLWWEFDSTRGVLRHQMLSDWARSLAECLSVDANGRVILRLPPEMAKAYAQSGGEHIFAIRDESGARLFGAGGSAAPAPAVVPEDGVFYRHDPDGPGPLNYFGIAEAVTVGNHHLTVQVEHRAADYQVLMQSVADEFFEDGAWMGLPFLLLVVGVGVVSIHSSLRPLRDLTRALASIGPAATEIRLPEAEVPIELRPLIRGINNALGRLEEGMRIQQQFTADAAHELRTPLAVLAAHLDSLPDQETAAALRRDVEGVSRLVGQMLRATQLESLVIEADRTSDLNRSAEEVATWLAPVAIRDGRSIEVSAAPAPVKVRGNCEAIFHAVRNLVENGLTYTPPGTAVVISVETAPPAICVRDYGPGVPVADRHRIFQRFSRLSRNVNGAGLGGAGLGLAIVRQTMEAHGGTVSVEDAEGGGAVFRLRFPAVG